MSKSKVRIKQTLHERVLLSELMPYETPINFSNWGSYNVLTNINRLLKTPIFERIYNPPQRQVKHSIPYTYEVKLGEFSSRRLWLIHPKHSEAVVGFYKTFDIHITKHCSKSNFSLRSPHAVAKCFYYTAPERSAEEVQDLVSDTPYASSYFRYDRYSHIHKFYESTEYVELEKQWPKMQHADISKCFHCIYTHSIEWAVKGKRTTKMLIGGSKPLALPFESHFDKLIGSMNYDETHGIPVGPELSRIFAEVILQRIDREIEQRMQKAGYTLNRDYACRRYIDDYFVYYRNEDVLKHWNTVAKSELEIYKLFFNDSKTVIRTRPFITPQSVLKSNLAEQVSAFANADYKAQKPHHNRLLYKARSMLAGANEKLAGSTAFLISALTNVVINTTASIDDEATYHKLYFAAETASYCLRVDPSVTVIYKYSMFTLAALQKSSNLRGEYKSSISELIRGEMQSSITDCLRNGLIVETLNLLILAAEDQLCGILSEDFLDNTMDLIRQHNGKSRSSTQSLLGYFELVSLTYVCGRKGNTKLLETLFNETIRLLSDRNVSEDAEAAYLFLDMCSCPHFGIGQKIKIGEAALKKCGQRFSPSTLSSFLKDVQGQVWFFDWNEHRDLRKLLQKKQYLAPY